MGMFVAYNNRIIQALFSCLLCFLISGCPGGKTKDTLPNRSPEATSAIPLHQTPGLHLVYTVNDPRTGMIGAECTAHVLIAEPDGTRREVLFSYPGFIFHTVPSPAGTHVAFVGNVPRETGQDERHLFLYNLDSGSYMDVSASGYYSRAVETPPLFNPDGERVMFISRWSIESGEYNIFKCNVATGQTIGLYTDPVEDVPLGLMPDGQCCIAVKRIPNAPGVYEYISVNIDTGSTVVLHRFNDVTKVGPAHVDDSGAMLYCDIKLSEEGTGAFAGTRSREILAIDLESGTETTLLDPNTVSYVYQIFKDADGNRRLLLRRQEAIPGEETPMSRIAIVSADGSDFQHLTDTSARSYFLPPPSNIPPLAPDDSLLFYYRKDPVFEHEDIWVMKPDGTQSVNISNTAGYNEGSAGWIVIPQP